MRATEASFITVSSLAVALVLSPGCRGSTSQPPDRTTLVNIHLRGHYDQVMRWCPMMLESPSYDPEASDWCLFALPAAMWLALDRDGALAMVHTVCIDPPSGKARIDEEFRLYYVSEIVRWYSMPLQVQRRDAALLSSQGAVVRDLSGACEVDPVQVAELVDTRIEPARPGRH